jgi:hypothetical protein
MLDRRQNVDRSIEVWSESRAQGFGVIDCTMEQFPVVCGVGSRLTIPIVERLRFNRRSVAARDQPLIQPL